MYISSTEISSNQRETWKYLAINERHVRAKTVTNNTKPFKLAIWQPLQSYNRNRAHYQWSKINWKTLLNRNVKKKHSKKTKKINYKSSNIHQSNIILTPKVLF